MIEIRAIQEKDYPEVTRIWRDVLDIPVSDECLAETYGRMGKDDATPLSSRKRAEESSDSLRQSFALRLAILLGGTPKPTGSACCLSIGEKESAGCS